MIELDKINDILVTVESEQKKVQEQLEKLLRRREELHTLPLPQADFIKLFIEEQSLRENQLSERLFRKYSSRIHEPMWTLKIRGENDSPLTWPKGHLTIPVDVFHILFSKEINAAIVEALEKWSWPEEVGPTRAEREKELAKLDEEIDSLKSWLDKAKKFSSG